MLLTESMAPSEVNFQVPEGSVVVRKGSSSLVESYSAFFDAKGLHTDLAERLFHRQITDVYIAGLAYDVCVGKTLLLVGCTHA